MRKNNFCHPVTLAWFSIQILVNSKIFKLLLYLSLTHLRAQITCYELKGDLSPVMLKEIFHENFENFESTRICVENHASVTGWQKLFFSYKCFQLSAAFAIATFELYGWKCSLCTDVPPPSVKIGRGDVISSPDFYWGRGDVCTRATENAQVAWF